MEEHARVNRKMRRLSSIKVIKKSVLEFFACLIMQF
jgi:hypothetical protein